LNFCGLCNQGEVIKKIVDKFIEMGLKNNLLLSFSSAREGKSYSDNLIIFLNERNFQSLTTRNDFLTYGAKKPNIMLEKDNSETIYENTDFVCPISSSMTKAVHLGKRKRTDSERRYSERTNSERKYSERKYSERINSERTNSKGINTENNLFQPVLLDRWIGLTFTKKFETGYFTGTIKYYDPIYKWFLIEYDDGDKEELNFNAVFECMKESYNEIKSFDVI
jgi:hypothetical protein